MDALLDTLLAGMRATPARRAIVEPRGAGGRTIARAALATRIEALAAGFTRLGLRAGDAAVFAVRPGIWSIAALFGLLRAGANVIAVDPGVRGALFLERMRLVTPRLVIADSLVFAASAPGPLRLLLRRKGIDLPHIQSLDSRFVRVGPWLPGVPRAADIRDVVKMGEEAPVSAAGAWSAERTMGVIFTSGTTAAPKAVEHSARSLGAAFSLISRLMPLTPEDVVYSTQSHQALAALLAGATAVIPARMQAKDALAAIARHRVTHLYAVPFEMAAMLAVLESTGARLPDHLAHILLGSAPIGRNFLRRLRAVCALRTDIWCAYAMTELVPAALVESREKLADLEADGDLVGRPVDGVEARLGTDGELFLRGPNLFKSYIGGGAVDWHATGDLARFDPAGRIRLLGRKKDMIIRGAYNIYPSLYEETIAGIPGVAACALAGIADERAADEKLVLAIEPKPGEDAARLRARVAAALRTGPHAVDAFALPDAIVVCALPYAGRSRKLDRARLARLMREKAGAHDR
jgi:long-chain acyl-CoA synthetase